MIYLSIHRNLVLLMSVLTAHLNRLLIIQPAFLCPNSAQVQRHPNGKFQFPSGRTCYAGLSRTRNHYARLQMIMVSHMRRSSYRSRRSSTTTLLIAREKGLCVDETYSSPYNSLIDAGQV